MKRLLWWLLPLLVIATPANADFEFSDLACETTTTTGTGTLNLAGAATNYLTFLGAGIDSADTVPYQIVASDGKFETGIGTFTDASPDTLARTSVKFSSDGAAAALNLPAGTHTVCIGPILEVFSNADKGDITTSNGFATWNIDADTISTTELADNAVAQANVGDDAIGEPELDFIDGDTHTDEHCLTYESGGANGTLESQACGDQLGSDADRGDITVSGGSGTTADVDPDITVTSTADAVDGILWTFHHNDPTADAADDPFDIVVNAGDDDETVARLQVELIDDATTTEDASWNFFADVAGTEAQQMAIGNGVIVGAGTTFPGASGSVRQYSAADAVDGPKLQIHHDDSADANDFPFTLEVFGGADDEEIGSVALGIIDPATTSEDTQWQFTARQAGADLTLMSLVGDDRSARFFGTTDVGFIDNVQIEIPDAPPILNFFRNDTSITTNNALGAIYFIGNDTTSNTPTNLGFFSLEGESAHAAGDNPTAFVWQNTPDGSATMREVWRMDSAGGLISANATPLKLSENDAGGANWKAFISPTAITADTTCTFENDANFIPDSCVGDGSDASDARLKSVIGPAGDVGSLIDQIKIYDFTWTADSEKSEQIRKDRRGFGPLAQELFNVNADWVDVGGDDPVQDPWTWKPNRIVPYLIVEAQHQRDRLEALEAEAKTLKFSATATLGSIAGAAFTDKTITVPGLKVGDVPTAAVFSALPTTVDCRPLRVSADDTLIVRCAKIATGAVTPSANQSVSVVVAR